MILKLTALFLTISALYGPQIVQAWIDPLDACHHACSAIANVVSNASTVYYPWDTSGHYAADIAHYSPPASQNSTCSVEPGSAEDVARILNILSEKRPPFAIKGGDHSQNFGFSSTTGVHIAMSRFSEIVYDEKGETVTIGAGLIWDELYAALDPLGRGVVGGRVSSIGVGGVILGGGYSWKTNQYGLAVDNVLAFELVKPDGEIVLVTDESDPDLFFVLKGGHNNYGIVTRFTLKTHPQDGVWGGHMIISEDNLVEFSDALADFAQNATDPKAAAIGSFFFDQGLATYDAPAPPGGVFDRFLGISSIESNFSTEGGMLSLLQSAGSSVSNHGGARGLYSTTPVAEYSPGFIAFARDEVKRLSTSLPPNELVNLGCSLEPFLPDYLSRAAEGSSAYPPSRKTALLPTALGISWKSTSADAQAHDLIRELGYAMSDYASKVDGQDLSEAYVYPNYALADEPLEAMYGASLAKMREVRERVDPTRLMALAGGFKV
ncbi:hypothetical protein HDZ31DRAFT_77155 [Schizophyllum fasciatum]